jgi:hypothetical protein
MTPTSLKLEVNSRERRDRLVGMLERELMPLIQRTEEKSSDISQISLYSPERGWLKPDEVLKGLISEEMLASEPAPKEPPSEEVQQALRQASLQAIQAYYRTWPDQSVPALGNITPREAVRTERGRKAVEDLIRSFESYGFDSDQPQPDFNQLRRDLALLPSGSRK